MRKRSIEQTLAKGKHYTNRSTLSLVVAKQAENQKNEIAIAVKKALGNAVVRNRIRRRVRAAADQLLKLAQEGHSLVIFPAKTAKNCDFSLLQADLASLFRKAGLLAEC